MENQDELKNEGSKLDQQIGKNIDAAESNARSQALSKEISAAIHKEISADVDKEVEEEIDKQLEVISRFQTTLLQNKELFKQNQELLAKVEILQNEAEEARQVREKRKQRLEKLAKRKRKEENQPIMLEHYEKALQLIGEEQTLAKLRAKLAVTLLFVTGARISEILLIEKEQIKHLFLKERPFIALDRLKREPKNKKAYLSPIGSKIIKKRRHDFELFERIKSDDSKFLFPSKNDKQKPLSREHFTRQINGLLKRLSQEFNLQFTSHSFRKGYITKLWKDTKDIEFVRCVIGHSSITTTQRYIQTPSDEEIAERLNKPY